MIIFYIHSSSPSQHGWCGTCDNDLKYEKDIGKRGYCDKFESGGGTPDRPQSEMTRPTFKKDWGWCRATCDERPSLANVLQVGFAMKTPEVSIPWVFHEIFIPNKNMVAPKFLILISCSPRSKIKLIM